MDQAPKSVRTTDAAQDLAMCEGLQQPNSASKRRKPFRTRAVSIGRSLIGDIVDISEVIAIAEGEDHK